MTVQAWFNRIWYRAAAPPWWLVPLALGYRAIASSRRFLYARGLLNAQRLPCPVIVVGNVTAGGTGKTPLVIWLAVHLQALGAHPGIVTRGYSGSERGVRLVEASDDPGRVGDEAVLLARRTRVGVAVGRDRPAAARCLLAAGCDVILSDDGLQHHALARDCEIVVVDGARHFGNGRLLPAGPLRETPARLRDADAVVVNGFGAPLDRGLKMRLEATAAVSLHDGTRKSLAAFSGVSVHAVAGIGNPDRFFAMLRRHGIEVTEHALADHARITPADILFADRKIVLMTEKDAVKCTGLGDDRHWYVPVDACFSDADGDALLGIVTQSMAARIRSEDEVPLG
jgi:tetraacyldisaccharide 4'-kinase